MVQLRVVLLLVLKGTAVLARAQLARVDAVCLQEALVGHAERLPDGLSNDLGLWKDGSFVPVVRADVLMAKLEPAAAGTPQRPSSLAPWSLPCANGPVLPASTTEVLALGSLL